MTAPHSPQIVDGYLARLDRELRDLAAPERSELLSQIEAHIAEARSALPDETDSDLLNILDRLGSPEDVAESVRSRPAPEVNLVPIVAPASTTRDRLVIIAGILAWAGGLASGIGAFAMFSESYFGSTSFGSLLAAIIGVASGILAFRRTGLAVAGLVFASLVVGINVRSGYMLPPGVNSINTGALVLLIGAGAFAGVANVIQRLVQPVSPLDPR